MLTLLAEIAAFKKVLPKLLADHDGEFVVLKDTCVQHYAASYEAALAWGYDRYGLDGEFYVKQVSSTKEVAHFRHAR